MNIREISDVFKDTANQITALKSYNFGWPSDRTRSTNTEDYQELNEFPRVFFSVPTITGSDQTRKQDTYQVTLFFDDLLGYNNEGDADLTLQLDKWATLQVYATAFLQKLNKIKQSILPNYIFIPDAPAMTFDSFTGLQRLVTVQVTFNLVVPTNCGVDLNKLISVFANVVASASAIAELTNTNNQKLIDIYAQAVAETDSSAQISLKINAVGSAVATSSATAALNMTFVSSVLATAFTDANAFLIRIINAEALAIAQSNADAMLSKKISASSIATATSSALAGLNMTFVGNIVATATTTASAEIVLPVNTVEASVTATADDTGVILRLPKWDKASYDTTDIDDTVAFVDSYDAVQTQVTSTFGSLVGATKWIGGVLASNGKIYGIPADTTSILEIDPSNNSTSTFGSFTGTGKWAGGVLAPNGKIYAIPLGSTSILEIDPSNNTTSTFGSFTGSSKWLGGVLAPNGKIYAMPYVVTSILIIDPSNNTTSTFGSFTGTGKWFGGVLAPNGKIYGIPASIANILEILDSVTINENYPLSRLYNKL